MTLTYGLRSSLLRSKCSIKTCSEYRLNYDNVCLLHRKLRDALKELELENSNWGGVK